VRKRKSYLNLMNAVQIIIMVFLLSGFAGAQDYSLEYSQFGISGGVSQTTDYLVVDLITELGISGQSQSSGNYTVTPTIGSEDAQTSVKCWMLY
jgi:hypothetical protein